MLAKKTFSAIAVASLLAGCNQDKPQAAATTTAAAAPADSLADAKLAVDGGKIWYRVTGTGTGTPVILLHGGPGLSSYYLKPFEDLGNDRKVVRYDQLGGGKSDRITDTTMFTIKHFVDELEALRAHLGYDKVDLLGHSWGSMLALEYYRVHPEHVKSMVLGSAALDIPAWEKNAKRLIATLSDSSQRAIRVAEQQKKYDTPGYANALNEFYSKYLFRHPLQADMDSTNSQMNEGIYVYMQGPSEFTITGTLKHYDSTPYLKDVKVPVLFTVGEFDEANPDIIRKQAAMTPGAEFAELKGSAHVTPWDARDENVRIVREFLNRHEK